jgi:hypothetical protein
MHCGHHLRRVDLNCDATSPRRPATDGNDLTARMTANRLRHSRDCRGPWPGVRCCMKLSRRTSRIGVRRTPDRISPDPGSRSTSAAANRRAAVAHAASGALLIWLCSGATHTIVGQRVGRGKRWSLDESAWRRTRADRQQGALEAERSVAANSWTTVAALAAGLGVQRRSHGAR